jgi:TRAP-type C4-dicarboxylate transport system substrate-binding protein
MSSIGELIINTEVWAALTPQQQEAIRSATTTPTPQAL